MRPASTSACTPILQAALQPTAVTLPVEGWLMDDATAACAARSSSLRASLMAAVAAVCQRVKNAHIMRHQIWRTGHTVGAMKWSLNTTSVLQTAGMIQKDTRINAHD
eukprot:1141573-Pelagomonas_calceolata.AAC.2